MAKYRLKRKTFGVVQSTLNGVGDTVRTTAGGVMEGTGKALDTGVAGTLGGIAGAGIATGGALGLAGLGLGIPGAVGGYILGKAATRGIGKGLKNAGQDLQT